MKNNNIPCAIYYPIPLHSQKAYKDERKKEADFEVSNTLKDQVISLPTHTELEISQLQEITRQVSDFMGDSSHLSFYTNLRSKRLNSTLSFSTYIH